MMFLRARCLVIHFVFHYFFSNFPVAAVAIKRRAPGAHTHFSRDIERETAPSQGMQHVFELAR